MMARITFGLVFVSLLVGGLFIGVKPLEAQLVDPSGVERGAYDTCSTINYDDGYYLTIGTVGYTPDWGEGTTPIEGNVGNRSVYGYATISGDGGDCGTDEPVTPAPTASLSASTNSVVQGNVATLTWSSANATSCTGTGFSTGGATSGSASVVPGVQTTYTVTCVSGNQQAIDSETITVTYPRVVVPWAALTANPTSVDKGRSTQLTWSSANATSCIGTGFSTGGATSGSVSVTPITSTTYRVTCNGANASATVTVVERANLAISGISPSTATVGVGTTLSATISNTGDIAASGFSTRFQAKPQGEVGSTDSQSGNMSLNAGSSGTASVGHTFTSVGAYLIRACADIPANAIAEYNENDNCTSWTAVSVMPIVEPPVTPTPPVTPPPVIDPPVVPPVPPNPPAQPVAGISVSPTSIEDGDSSTLTWSCTGASTSALGSGFSTSGQLSGSLSVSPSQTTTYTVVCRNGSDSATASASLTVLTAAFDMTFTGSPLLVRAGGQSTLTWTLGRSPTCTLQGPGLQRSNIRTSGSQVVTITESSTYSLACRKGQSAETRNVTIRIIPSIGEF